MMGPRYLIVSTVATFVALGLGIFLGSIMVKDDTLVKYQESLVGRIESEFSLLRKDREALYEKLLKCESLLQNSLAFGEMSLTELTYGKLDGMQVTLVVPGQGLSYDEAGTIAATLENAGASISKVVHVRKRLEPISTEDARELAVSLGISKSSPHAVGQELADAIAVLATGAGAFNSPPVDALLRSDYVKIDLLQGEKCDAVIVAGGSRDPAHAPLYTDIPLIKAFQKIDKPVVIVESGSVAFSFLTEYTRLDIPTIEQADTPMGRFSLIQQLADIMNGD